MSRYVFSKKEYAAVLGVVLLFLLSSYLAGRYGESIRAVVAVEDLRGMALYVFLTIVAVVAAPVSTMPFLPLAVGVWGSFTAAVLSILGWTIGAMIAFLLARRYGRPLIERIADMRMIEQWEARMPSNYLFWSIVFFRMAIPVDVLSYAIGLFTEVPLSLYFWATLIGVAPFAFIFSYASALPLIYQIGAFLAAIGIIFLGYRHARDRVQGGRGEIRG